MKVHRLGESLNEKFSIYSGRTLDVYTRQKAIVVKGIIPISLKCEFAFYTWCLTRTIIIIITLLTCTHELPASSTYTI